MSIGTSNVSQARTCDSSLESGQRASVPAGLQEHRSPGFRLLTDRLQEGLRYNILDLGLPTGSSIEFLSRYACKIHYEYLNGLVEELDAIVAEELPDIADSLPDYEPGTEFDIVLAWDLLNYFDPGHLATLGQHLARYCRRNTLLFAHVCTRQGLPQLPEQFRIVDEDRLAYQTIADGPRTCPRLGQRELEEKLAGFQVMHTYLLPNGMQEYVFRFC